MASLADRIAARGSRMLQQHHGERTESGDMARARVTQPNRESRQVRFLVNEHPRIDRVLDDDGDLIRMEVAKVQLRREDFRHGDLPLSRETGVTLPHDPDREWAIGNIDEGVHWIGLTLEREPLVKQTNGERGTQ